jgi:phage RecT family recombinase
MTKEITILDTTKKQIFSAEKAIKAVLPKNFDVNKFMATLWLEVQKTPKLAECNNLLEIAKDVASFGLIIGGAAQQAYLIPFKKNYKEGNEWKSKMVAQLIVGYKGYIAKLEEAGYTVEVELATKREVEEGRFEEYRGSDAKIIHRPIREGIRDRENIALAYCIIKGNGTSPVMSVLSREEIEEMAKTDQYENGKKAKEKKLGNVWTQNQRSTDFGQMCLKTVIRNCVKKVNLRIANELSVYEGEKEKEIIEINPQSKTAAAHNPPAELQKVYEEPELPFADVEKVVKQEQVMEQTNDFVDREKVEQNEEMATTDLLFVKHEAAIKSLGNEKGLNTYIATSDFNKDLEFLKENAEDLHAQIIYLKNEKIKSFKK